MITKFCPRCKLDLPRESFHKDKNRNDGLKTPCKNCRRESTDITKRNAYALTYFTGLTQDQYDAMLQAQCGQCAICGSEDPKGRGRFHVDHDHSCCPKGVSPCGSCTRALLCDLCNRGLGFFCDNPEILDSASKYLKQWVIDI